MVPPDKQLAAYLEASAQSYGGQLLPLMTVPPDCNMPLRIELGSQPLGCCHVIGNTFAVIFYFEPCILFFELKSNGELIEVGAIRGVDCLGQSFRLFPPWAATRPYNHPRGQTVNLGPKATMVVSANASRTFYAINPPGLMSEEGEPWRFTNAFTLPDHDDGKYRFVHAAHIDGFGNITTVESTGDLILPWWHCTYSWPGGHRPVKLESAKPQLDNLYYLYGIGKRRGEEVPWFVTDSRCEHQRGLYRGDDLIIPEITGTGVCFLDDGTCIVTEYGCEKRHRTGDSIIAHRKSGGGDPGSITIIPAACLPPII